MATGLHRFHGGLDLPGHKAPASEAPLRACPLPPRLHVPLLQHAGAVARVTVEPGERVRRGDLLGDVSGERGAAVHAPAAGRVEAVGEAPLAGLDGLPVPHVVLRVDPDPGAPARRLPPLDAATAPRTLLLERVREAGVTGLGGAGFPSAEKLSVARDCLILNGAECEPWISCDDRLIRDRPEEVLHGARLMARIVGATRVLVAVEDRMQAALDALRQALASDTGTRAGDGDPRIELVAVPSRYPEGGERQLIEVLTGREVPRGGLPRDIGVLVHNVATATAAWRAVDRGEVLTHRIVTVAGPGVAAPCNLEVAIGTPMADLVQAAGGYTEQARRLVLGGPMMGHALPHDGFAVTKTTNCVLVLDAEATAAAGPQRPCIRCGACAEACPARLLPQQLLWDVLAADMERGRADGLPDCIECGCCDLVCPSRIPLAQHFRHARGLLRQRDAEAAEAEAARLRHEARQKRLAEDAERRARQARARKDALSSPDAVAAAIARARARKAGAGD